ncbi:Uncharacterised protein [Klebsiella pneumoniae]|nr:Uncharacterised protein [Enterobacter hormaechei]SBJ39433.1 Uncharacterised protein [Klebsiella pneumoniae]
MILHNSIRVAQNLSRRNPYAQINCVRLTYGHRNPLNHLNYRETRELASSEHEKYSGSWQNNVKRGLEVPTKNVESCEDNQPSLRGEAQRLRGTLSLAQTLQVNKSHSQNNPSLRGAVHSITESNPVQLSGSDLAFLRCSDLSLRPQASRTHAEKLAPALSAFSRSTLASISSISSCGNRIFFCADLAFTALVAIYPPAYSEGTPYQKNSLTCTPTENIVGVHLEVEDTQDTAKPGSVTSTNRASDHNVTEAYIMACIQHTQTRPKYQYRFLALSAIGRNVIHITATTEREAREQSPAGCVMVFAGRLPVREVRHA